MIIFKFENSKKFHICDKCKDDGFVESLCKRFRFFIGEKNISKYDIQTLENDENICKTCLKKFKGSENA